MMATSHGRSWGHFATGVLLSTVAFAIVGPLVGMPVFGLAVGVLTPPGGVAGAAHGFAAMVVLFPVTLLVGYFVAWKAAVAAGIAVSLVSLFIRRDFYLYGIAMLVGAISSILFVPDVLGETPAVSFFIERALAGILSTAICTRLTRGIRLRFNNVRGESFKELAK